MLKYLLAILVLFVSLNISAADLKGQNRLIDGVDEYRFFVKLSADLNPDVEKGKVRFFAKTRTANSSLQNEINNLIFYQVLPLTDTQRAEVRSGEKSRALKGKFNRKLFSGLLELSAAKTLDKYELLNLANRLEKYEEVEYCEISSLKRSPLDLPLPPSQFSVPMNNRATPDFSDMQLYKDGDRGGDTIGINALYAWGLGIKGEGVKVSDVEWGWNFDHEDMAGSNFIEGLAIADHYLDEHGTAVAGVIFAKDNGIGVTGMAHEVESFTGYSETGSGPGQGRVAAIGLAIEELDAGDVLMYELQTSEGAPVDLEQTVWDLTKAGTDAGVIIISAAGNGSQNLDGPSYKAYNDRGDNGAIMIGAAAYVGRHTMDFSTYGSRVNLCGWGEWVTTTGYGILYNGGLNAKYCQTFNGTSSATPMVASAAILVQSYAKKHLNKTLTPKEMRGLLIETGTPQGAGGHIGPQPNVKAAILRLDELYGDVAATTTKSKNGYHPLKFSVKNNRLVFQFPESISSGISLDLFSMNGTKIGSCEAGTKNEGYYSLPISSITGTALSKGMYLARLTSGNVVYNVKFMIK